MSANSPLTILFAALYLAAVFLFFQKKYTLSLVLLLAGSFFLRLEMTMLDPFIHNWDERFHALVAKNMMDDPFRPMLYKHPAIPYDYTSWCCNHIWIHKQPLFLWQMALSMKIFGVNEVALRLPSVIMGTLMVFFTWRIGRIATGNYTAAFVSAFLFSLSWFQLELTSGLTSLDHNDIAFSFYITASIWSFSEYLQNRSWKWVVLTGVFSGGAILCKWLVGLLVYAGWGIVLLLQKERRRRLRSWLHLGAAIAVTAIVMLPWQIYILSAFPLESAWEYDYNTRHLFEVLEGHDHEWWFFFSLLPLHYGKYFIPFLVAGILLLLMRNNNKPLAIALSVNFLIVYLFFSIVPTKLLSFTFIVAPLGFLFIGIAFAFLIDKLTAGKPWMKYAMIPVCFFLGIYCLKPWNIINERKPGNAERSAEVHNAAVYRSLPDSIEGSKTVVINNLEHRNIELMFYKEVTAYPNLLNENLLDSLHERGFRIYSFPAYGKDSLPAFIRDRDFVKQIPQQLR